MNPTQKCHCCQGTGKEMNSKGIGHSLKVRRLLLGIKSQHIAKKIGVSGSMLSYLESGKRQWTEMLIQKYRRALK